MAIPDRLKDNVRAVLLSKTDGSGVLVSNFLKDYKAILHEPLMYKDLGFQSIQEFIKAVPDVCRLEFSEKDMAYRLYGISKPNTYQASFTKRAEKGPDTSETKGRRGGGEKAEKASLGSSVDEEWKPNWKGLYTLCLPNRKGNGLATKEAVATQFSKVGEVVEISIIKAFTFVRYRNQENAKTAVRMWGDSLGLRRADEKMKGDQGEVKNRKTDSSNSNSNNNSSQRSSLAEPGSYNQEPAQSNGYQSGSILDEPVNDAYASSSDAEPEVVDDEEVGLIQVYIGNWPNEGSKHDLEEVLQVQGFKADGCKIIQGKGNTHKCFLFHWPIIYTADTLKHGMEWETVKQHAEPLYAFVDFRTMSEAQKFMSIMNGQTFMSRDLVVRLGNRSESIKDSKAAKSNMSHGNIEEEFERLYVHKAKEGKLNPPSPVTRTINNVSAKKLSDACSTHSDSSNSPSKIPPLEKIAPNLDDSMPDLEPISSPKMPSLIPNTNNSSVRNGYKDMPDLEPMAPVSPCPSNMSSNQGMDSVQLFIGNFPYGTKEWELSRIVEPYGGHGLVIMNKNVTNRSTYGFATFDDLQQAQMAICNLDQSVFKNRPLTVAMASPDPIAVKMTSPDVSYSGGPLARITCTVGGNNERKVSVEDQSLSQISPISTGTHSSTTQGTSRSLSHMVSKRDDGFRYHKFTILLKDYSQIVARLRGEEEFLHDAGQKMRVLVTHVENERFFWGQILVDGVKGVSCNLQGLQRLQSDLQTAERSKSLTGMGRCMALFEGEWYRGWCTHYSDKEGVLYGDVFYLDYGNMAMVPMADLFYTKPHIWTLPPLAKPFKLAEPMCQLKSLQDQVVTVEILEPASYRSNYLSTVLLDYQ